MVLNSLSCRQIWVLRLHSELACKAGNRVAAWIGFYWLVIRMWNQSLSFAD